MSAPAKKFNLVEEINSTFRGRSSTVSTKPTTEESFKPVEPKKKRLGSFFMSFMSSDEEAEYEPEPPCQEIDWKSLDFGAKKETGERCSKRKSPEEEDFDTQKRDLEREISDLKRKLEYDRRKNGDTSKCQLCNQYIADLEETKIKRLSMGANWYSRTRGKINARATRHRESMHTAAIITEGKIKELELKLIQLYEKRNTDREIQERKRRREEKEEEERKAQEEEEFRRKEERRIKFQIAKCEEMERWRKEWEDQEEERRRDFNPEYEERRWMERYAHWDY